MLDKREFAEKCVELNSEYLAYKEITGSEDLKEIAIESFKLKCDDEVQEIIKELLENKTVDWFKEDSVNALRDIIVNGKTAKEKMDAVKLLNTMLSLDMNEDDISEIVRKELSENKKKEPIHK